MGKIMKKYGEGQVLHGFHVDRIVPVPVIQAMYYQYHHIATGARGIHVDREDIVNVLTTLFKTIPSDSSGMPHILEHRILAGSKRFPVKEPFANLLRSSPNAFLNAMTYPDRTVYPFASAYDQDLRNIREIYLDAVFAALLRQETFWQEGWHYEFDDKGNLIRNGIVLNEMKVANITPARIMENAVAKFIFPTTAYRFDSGGDPAEIPALTNERMVEFYQRHYHPSNAYIYSYGPFPLEDHLAFLEQEYLSNFERIDPKTDIPREPRWQKPRTGTIRYPLKNEDPLKKYQHAVAWLTAPVSDYATILALEVLVDILINDSAAPLRKALIESSLGSDLSDCSHLETDYRDAVFSIGLKDIEKKDAPEVEKIIFDTLNKLAAEGIDEKLVKMTLHQFEFFQKEVKSWHGTPYGLTLLLRMASSWIHGGDPVNYLDMSAVFADLSQKAKTGYFEGLIEQYLLNNPHRVHLTMEPDADMLKRRAEETKRELGQIRAEMTAEEKELIVANTAKLKTFQDQKEDASCIKTMKLRDMPGKMRRISRDKKHPDTSLMLFVRPTNGILYFNAVFGGVNLPNPLIPLVPLFCKALPEIGTKSHDYAEMVRLTKANTGGICILPRIGTMFGKEKQCLPLLRLSGKCFDRKVNEMYDILRELVLEYDFSDLKRLHEIIREDKSALERHVVMNGHAYALQLAARGFDAIHELKEKWTGIRYLQSLQQLVRDISADKHNLGRIAAQLQKTGEALFCCKNMKAALTGEQAVLNGAADRYVQMKKDLKAGSAMFSPEKTAFKSRLFREGWITDMQNSHSACVFEPIHMDHHNASAVAVMAQMLKRGFFWDEIRVKGGAYGGMASYDYINGTLAFLSYRDPNIVRTQKIFASTKDYIRSGNYTDRDIENAKIVLYESYNNSNLTHEDMTFDACIRKQLKITDNARNKFWRGIREVTREDLIRAAEHIDYADASVAVIANGQMLKIANQEFEQNGEQLLKLHKI